MFHYLPFLIMGRVTYVHHYYPALYFAILVAGFCVDWTTRKLPPKVRWGVYLTLYAVVIGLFVLFSPVVFGMQGSNRQYAYLRWFDRWRISDATMSEYYSSSSGSPSVVAPSVVVSTEVVSTSVGSSSAAV